MDLTQKPVREFHCAREDCTNFVVLPQMPQADLVALLELNGWRKKWPMFWICCYHQDEEQAEETIIQENTDGQ